MEKYYLGRKISVVYVDECMIILDQSMKELAEKIEKRRKYFVEQIQELPKFAMEVNKRPPEPNDWRRKGRRGFNGYNRYI